MNWEVIEGDCLDVMAEMEPGTDRRGNETAEAILKEKAC
jgi:hypothetical protein